MRILFCNIAWMDYYKGIVPGKDEPKNGGSYVKDTKDAHEKYNFKPELLKLKGFPEGEYCLGFVETKSTSAGKRNQLNIEKIEGCSDLKNDTEVDDVLVVYCALYPDSFDKETYVVGWYKHATVYRRYEKLEFDTEASDNERSDNESAADEKYIQLYNAIAIKEDCVLLPRSQRRKCQERKRVWHSDLDSQMYGLQEEKMIISIYLIFLTGLRIRLKPMMVKTG